MNSQNGIKRRLHKLKNTNETHNIKSRKNSAKSKDELQIYFEKKAKLWILRFFLDFGMLWRYLKDTPYGCKQVADFIGWGAEFDNDNKWHKNHERIIEMCQNERDILERDKSLIRCPDAIFNENLARIKEAFNLDSASLAVLEFAIIKEEVESISSVFSNYDKIKKRNALNIIAGILGEDSKAVERVSFKNSPLMANEILDTSSSLDRLFELYCNNFVELMFQKHDDMSGLLGNFVLPCESGTLSLSDYDYIKEIGLLRDYLKNSLGNKGVNILLYGEPGTGKSELSKALAKDIGKILYEVRQEDEDGDAIDGSRRLRSYKLAQKFLNPNEAILLYDEVEDVLNIDRYSERTHNKAWLNKALEKNIVATIWITNNIYGVDRAIARRFDFVVEMNIPPKRVRKKLLEQYCGDKLESKMLKQIIKSPNLAPAIISRSSKVCDTLRNENYSKNFLMILNNTLKAQGHDTIKKHKKKDNNELPSSYSTKFVNTDGDLDKIIFGLKNNANARICLYGAPGTGKSAYGKFIAKKLDKPCLTFSASDLLSKWVGETEKNIKNAFKEAKDKKAVLIFDEVDSFLRDRNIAEKSWEVTKVNEMLVQMEKFNGIFIATTNLMNNLDKASLRRFDLKMEFRYLKSTQAVALFEKECENLGLKITEDSKNLISKIPNLAPGDFAAVLRQSRFNAIDSSREFYERLENEVKVKNSTNHALKAGFLA